MSCVCNVIKPCKPQIRSGQGQDASWNWIICSLFSCCALSTTAVFAAACSVAPDVVVLTWQEPLETLVTSHGVITRRRADSEWATQPLRSRSPFQCVQCKASESGSCVIHCSRMSKSSAWPQLLSGLRCLVALVLLGRLPARESWRRYRAAAAAPGSGSEAGSDGEDPLPPPMPLPDADSLQSGAPHWPFISVICVMKVGSRGCAAMHCDVCMTDCWGPPKAHLGRARVPASVRACHDRFCTLCTRAGMQRATQSLRRVHEAAAAVTREVRDGGLAERLGAGRSRRRHRPRRPYSPWLAQPYAKAGTAGLLAVVNVPDLRTLATVQALALGGGAHLQTNMLSCLARARQPASGCTWHHAAAGGAT